jgi:hypothetical protein
MQNAALVPIFSGLGCPQSFCGAAPANGRAIVSLAASLEAIGVVRRLGSARTWALVAVLTGSSILFAAPATAGTARTGGFGQSKGAVQ